MINPAKTRLYTHIHLAHAYVPPPGSPATCAHVYAASEGWVVGEKPCRADIGCITERAIDYFGGGKSAGPRIARWKIKRAREREREGGEKGQHVYVRPRAGAMRYICNRCRNDAGGREQKGRRTRCRQIGRGGVFGGKKQIFTGWSPRGCVCVCVGGSLARILENVERWLERLLRPFFLLIR